MCGRICVCVPKRKGEHAFFIMSATLCVVLCLCARISFVYASVYIYTFVAPIVGLGFCFAPLVHQVCEGGGVCGFVLVGWRCRVQGSHCRQLVFSLFPCIRGGLPQLPEKAYCIENLHSSQD